MVSGFLQRNIFVFSAQIWRNKKLLLTLTNKKGHSELVQVAIVFLD